MEERESRDERSHEADIAAANLTPPPLVRAPNEKSPRLGSSTSLEGEYLLSTMDSARLQGANPDSPSPKSAYRPVSPSPPKQPVLEEPGSNSSPEAPEPPTGKPPLLPRASVAKGRAATTHRRAASGGEGIPKPPSINQSSRVLSTGEYSAMSGITDPGYSPLKVSPNSSQQRWRHAKAKLTLVDLHKANPLETEAEIAILNAIEKKSNENDVAAVLPALPDEAVDMFQPPPSKLSQRILQHETSVGSRTSQHMPPDAPSDHEGRPRLNRLVAQRRMSQRIIDTSDFPSAEQKMAEASNLDVHEKLFVLAGQMQQVQEDAIEKDESNTTEDAWSPSDGHVPPATQADNLIQNANLLFRRSTATMAMDPIRETDVESEEYEETKKKGFLPFFRRGAKNSKKSDSQLPDDVETGMGGGDDDGPSCPSSHGSPRQSVWSPLSAGKKVARKARETKNLASDMATFTHDFFQPRKITIYRYCKNVLLWIFLPTLIVSFALYYAKNPKTCQDAGCPSWSWLFIFLFIRQVVTFTFAKLLELFIIDYLSLRNRLTVKVVGPMLTLLVVQSKGWPFTLLMWSILDFAMLYGTGKFANHWLFYQDAIPVFNADNPSGNVLTNNWYYSILIGCIIVSCAYAVKRLWMGVHLGKRTYQQYGKQLAAVMNDMLLISLLAGLGHDMESENRGKKAGGLKTEVIFKWDDMRSESEVEEEDSMMISNAEASGDSPGNKSRGITNDGMKSVNSSSSVGQQQGDVAAKEAAVRALPQLQSSLKSSQQIRITQLLGEWKEPPRDSDDELREISLGAILQFRQALSYMDDAYPFSVFFGPANTRELCVESSQKLYERLLLDTPDEVDLQFSTIAQVATGRDGEISRTRLKRLHRMFRPEADGHLGLLDFVRSIDKVYKDLRLLRASIANSSQLDQAFERVFNFFFAIVLAFIVLPIAGYDPVALILSLSGLIVGFAFMIGPASSKYFEGVLFILVRRPYAIGDRINISDPSKDTGRDGSPGWFVEKIDLFTTTVRYATTNEVATYSNGSLASERIINGARSPQAVCFIDLKFGIDVEFAKIEVFRTTVETFVKARTREWLALMAFRATRVEADLGFIQYVLVLQHVASWQDVGSILKSKAELASYCLEVSKQLEMRYVAPPLPVNLELKKPEVATQVQDVLESAATTGQFGKVPLGAYDD